MEKYCPITALCLFVVTVGLLFLVMRPNVADMFLGDSKQIQGGCHKIISQGGEGGVILSNEGCLSKTGSKTVIDMKVPNCKIFVGLKAFRLEVRKL